MARRIAKKHWTTRQAEGQLNTQEPSSARASKAKSAAFAVYDGFRFAWKDAEEVLISCPNFKRSRDIPRQFAQNLENALDAFFRQVAPPGESAPIAQYLEAPAADFEQPLSPPEGHAESASASSSPQTPAESTSQATSGSSSIPGALAATLLPNAGTLLEQVASELQKNLGPAADLLAGLFQKPNK